MNNPNTTIRRVVGAVEYISSQTSTPGIVEISTDEEMDLNYIQTIESNSGAPVVPTVVQVKELVKTATEYKKWVKLVQFDGITDTQTLNHGLNSEDLLITIYDNDTNTTVFKEVAIIDKNSISITETSVIEFRIVLRA